LVNRGVWRKTTDEWVELENATLVNEAGGVLELAAGRLYRYSGFATLQNSGLIKKVSSNSVVLPELTITGGGRVQVKGKFPLNFGQLSSQTLDESAKVMYN
jgi:hypothetical protein